MLDRIVAAEASMLEVSADLSVAEGKLQQLQQPRIAITRPKRILPNRVAKRTQGSSVVSTAGCVNIAIVSLCVLYCMQEGCYENPNSMQFAHFDPLGNGDVNIYRVRFGKCI